MSVFLTSPALQVPVAVPIAVYQQYPLKWFVVALKGEGGFMSRPVPACGCLVYACRSLSVYYNKAGVLVDATTYARGCGGDYHWWAEREEAHQEAVNGLYDNVVVYHAS